MPHLRGDCVVCKNLKEVCKQDLQNHISPGKTSSGGWSLPQGKYILYLVVFLLMFNLENKILMRCKSGKGKQN